jgi:hypothetical protein
MTIYIKATNIRISQAVCSIQNIITQIPGQVDYQQPVYMIDALGRSAPFYFEFIRSKEVGRGPFQGEKTILTIVV